MLSSLRTTVALGAALAAAAAGVPGPMPMPGIPAPSSPVAAAPADSTLPVGRSDRLILSALEGSVEVRVWDRSAVRVADRHGRGTGMSFRRTGAGPAFDGRGRDRHLRVDVPAWLPVEIRGRELAVEVRGTRGPLAIRTLDGGIRLYDVSGEVEARAMDGDVVAEDVSGQITLGSVDDDVLVTGARGSLVVSTNDGDLVLVDIDVDRLDAGTIDGDVRFGGVLRKGGSYRLVTHSGDVEAIIPRGSDVVVDVSTFDGSFQAGFPVTLNGIRSGRKASFTLGAGSARMSLEAFDGDIVVRDSAAGR